MKKSIFLLILLIAVLALGWGYSKLPNKTRALNSTADTRVGGPFDKTLVFVGDSIVEYLGNFDELRGYLKGYYPEKNILLLNYGYSSTSVLSLPDRVDKDSTHSGRIFQKIKDIPYDLVFIESMANNPLSEFPLEEGLEKQTQALDRVVASLSETHPKTSIIFMTPMAPSIEHYGEGAVDLSPEVRKKWAVERIAYIKNHIEFARKNNIPVLDIYQNSLINGQANLDLLNKSDYIHPSIQGIDFISKQIADFIYSGKLIENGK